MPQQPSARSLLRFGVFELDVSAGALRRQGRKVRLQQQPLQVLTRLLRNPGEVVTREELQQELWPGDTFVEFDQGLNTAIKKIRRALDDSADNPRFVETLPRTGYRFIAAVGAAPHASRRVPQILLGTRLWVATGAALVLAVVAGAAGWVLNQPRETAAIVPKPLTSYLGVESRPSFSPDGTQVVFDRQQAGGNFEVRRKTIGEDESIRLADGCCPVWSPDGRSIAFLGGQQQSWTLDRAATRRILWMSPLGGAARDLGEMHAEKDLGIGWHPGGEWLIVSDKPSPAEPGSLFAVSIDDGTRRKLTSPPPGSYDTHPAVSPDGEALVFARTGIGPSSVLHLVGLSQDLRPMSDPKPLTSIEVFSTHPAWLTNSRAILFVAGNLHAWGLHELQFSRPGWQAGIPRRLPFGGEGVVTPAISTSGQLAYATLRCGADIWRLGLDGAGRAPAPPERWISSTRVDHVPRYSPDGKKVAFASNRSGSHEIYVSNSDGSSARALTSFGGDAYTAEPRWSPDGQMVVFHSNPEGTKDVFVVSPNGEGLRCLFKNSAFSSWSRDGRWVYIESNGQVWKNPWPPLNENEEQVPITRNGGWAAQESTDGEFLFYLKRDTNGNSLWRAPLDGGEEIQIIEAVCNYNFTVVEDGIFYIPEAPPGEASSIEYLNFQSGRTTRLVTLPYRPAWGFSLSPDRRSILYAQYQDWDGDLFMVENFR